MTKEKEAKQNIKEEIRTLITKANGILNQTQNKQKNIAYIYAILSLLALSFFGLFAISPTVTTISNLRKQFNEESQALIKLKEKTKALQTLDSEYLNLQSDKELLDSAIPESAKASELIRQIEKLTITHKLIVQKIDSGTMEIYPLKKLSSPIFSFNFSVSVIGNESDINNFIHDLINMGRIIAIDKLTTGKQHESFSASITGRAFFYKN